MRIKFVLVFMPIVIFLLLCPISRQMYHHTTKLLDPSSRGHVSALQTGLENIKGSFLGYGLGTGGHVGSTFGISLAGESLYFTIAVERGIIGASIFLLMIFFLVIFCHKNRKYLKNEPIVDGLALITIISTLGYALASLTTEHWQAFVSAGIYWIYAGITVQAIIKYKKTGE